MTNPTLATPVTLGPWLLPPCDQPAPFPKDDRLVWTVRCALLKALGTSGDKKLTRLTNEMEKWDTIARGEMLAGFASGLGSAIAAGVSGAARDVSYLIFYAVRTLAAGADVALDPQVWVYIQQVTNAAPESAESRQAIESIRKYLGVEHEEYMEAIRMASAVMVAMRALNSWVGSDPEAGSKILSALGGHVGKLIGEVAADLADAEAPYGVGSVLGDLCGSVVVQCARFYYGV